MFKSYFITAVRNLWRNKAFSLINIAGLSVGIACCMLIFLYAKDELSYDQFHQNKDKLYRITASMTSPVGEIHRTGNSGMMPGPEFKSAVPEIETYVRVQSDAYTVKRGVQVFDQEALAVDDDFFTVFSFPLLYGDGATALKDIHSIVLSEEVAEKYFGTKNAIGRTLELKTGDNFEPFIVSGIAKKSPQNSSIKISMLVPMKFIRSQNDDKEWANFFLNTFVVIKPGSDIPGVAAKCNRVFNVKAAQQLKEAAEKYGYRDKLTFGLQPFLEMHLSRYYRADNGLTDASNPLFSYILSGIAVFVLLIACINFINLTVARSLKRAKEIGIRKVVGGQRKQLVMQFLGESFILSFIAFLFAIVLVVTVLPFFNTLADKALAFSYLLDVKLVGGYIVLFIVTSLLAGFYPALVLSGFTPVQTLYGRQQVKGKNRLARGLVVFQFTLATFLIIATIVVYNQFNFLLHYDLGYNDQNVAVVNAGRIGRDKLEFIKTELVKEPAVEMVSANQGGRWGTHAHINGDQDIEFDFNIIDENYFPLFQIPLKQGRNFSPAFTADSVQSVMVNESFAKIAGWKNAVGQTVDFFYNHRKYSVIGVVADYHYTTLNEKIGPQVFIEDPSYQYRDVFVKIRPGSTAKALRSIQATFKTLSPFQPYQYTFKNAENAAQYDAEAKWKQMISFGALLTLFISAIGLFGLATLAAEKRTKEIGIRKILGASVAGIVRRLSLDFVKLVMLAAILAAPAAWWILHTWIQSYPYRIDISGWVFAFAILIVVGMALFTISFQTIKAATANPVKSLRSE